MAQDSDYEKIPLEVLRNQFPDLKTRGKQRYIDELKKLNPDKLEKLAAYFSMNKASSLYIFKTIIPQHKTFLTTERLLKLKDKEIKQYNGEICIIQRIVIDENRNEAYLQIGGYSSKKTLRAVRPETLQRFRQEYRTDYTIGAIVHIDTGHLECRTGRENKANLAADVLSKSLYEEGASFSL